ncbi:Ferredoxin:Molybdopterin dehydrogenase, FAD-binding:(2Fe-2S)-binding:CO dehydrogenase [Fulvimarina pelagi HTCC2506]|uniref:Ferredoxin:Molybdopterin dehydrogenase, FAD-binding:(2Fe-2S)-binding:CO dehydrogenase n=1 Tax=Fulvimarina pelagi HTCC2506 TaxID=314231 RepID=Q0FXY9_9HYPH|nr:xanthine dehydrogenase small subunit [Fulvimarina pelagi]EAU39953.1 Ferredoxin:Molybdopterin dehydrogenase, FAD-binding:(2Fe-2S)-binding:CO dehydrogenase [Fulvimarina pelagi HTCC2506]
MSDQSAQPIRFLLNGEARSVSGQPATTTLLRYLRETERLTGTKEGCAEGDCGACTVLISENDGNGGLKRRPVNACIQFLPAMNGRAIETVEKLGSHRGADGADALREAMVEGHASQCGFCTPGFVVQLFSAWDGGKLTDRQAVKDQISGNLCRCTGYGPIIDAGETLAKLPKPDTLGEDLALAKRLGDIQNGAIFRYEAESSGGPQLWFAPENVDDLADIYGAHPDATLVAGATDVGLWVTKQHRDLSVLIDISKVRDLQMIEERLGVLYFGAGVTHTEALETLADIHPDLGEMMRRFAGAQIRNAGTVGGNIANGSPIGDLPPCLIALGARLYLRKGEDMRVLDLERFFVEYGKQDRAPGEFVVALEVPRLEDDQRYFAHKISKRFDSDISAVMAAFRLTFDGELVSEARLAFGGMAGVPKRASHAEAVLCGRPFDAVAVRDAQAALAEDFRPLTDMRASSEYRLKAAQNLLERFRLELTAERPARIAGFETGEARGTA